MAAADALAGAAEPQAVRRTTELEVNMLVASLLLSMLIGQGQTSQQSSVLVTTYPGSDEVMLWGQGLPDGRNYDYTVSTSQFAKLPAWRPEKEPPPLAISGALDIAKRATRAEHPEFTDFMPWSIQLHQVGSRDRESRWFYIVEMYPVLKGQPSTHSQVTVVVLMDGTVVKPREKKAYSR